MRWAGPGDSGRRMLRGLGCLGMGEGRRSADWQCVSGVEGAGGSQWRCGGLGGTVRVVDFYFLKLLWGLNEIMFAKCLAFNKHSSPYCPLLPSLFRTSWAIWGGWWRRQPSLYKEALAMGLARWWSTHVVNRCVWSSDYVPEHGLEWDMQDPCHHGAHSLVWR